MKLTWLQIRHHLGNIGRFIARWWIWISAAVLIVAGLSATRRATGRMRKANQRIQDDAEIEIEYGWSGVEKDTGEFLAAQRKAKKVKENVNKQFDRIAKTDPDASSIISDWNSDNRLRDDADAT